MTRVVVTACVHFDLPLFQNLPNLLVFHEALGHPTRRGKVKQKKEQQREKVRGGGGEGGRETVSKEGPRPDIRKFTGDPAGPGAPGSPALPSGP